MTDRITPADRNGFSSTPPSVELPRHAADDRNLDDMASEFSTLMDADNPSTRPDRRKGAAAASRSAHGAPSETQAHDTKQDPGKATAERKSDRETDSQEVSGRHVDRREKDASDRDQSSHDEAGSDSRQDSQQDTFNPGDAILQSMMGRDTAGVEPQAAAEVHAGGAGETMQSIVHEVASQVLVSDPAAGGREIRITLKDSVLPGTEVRILQDAGKLQVQFVTRSTDSQATLADNQSDLQARLTERLGHRDVVVSVKLDSAGHGDQQDGRSRQQRSVIDEVNAEEGVKRK